jgi:hypothetical protein
VATGDHPDRGEDRAHLCVVGGVVGKLGEVLVELDSPRRLGRSCDPLFLSLCRVAIRARQKAEEALNKPEYPWAASASAHTFLNSIYLALG